MTAQVPPQNLSMPPLDRTYSFIYADGKFDYFIQQPIYDGCTLMLGGGYYDDPQPNTFNDAKSSESVEQYLRDSLPHVFQWEGEENPEARVHMKWSGIMGFSEDGIPWVGPISEQLGGGKGQWICAGYTGEGTFSHRCTNSGMVNALLCAETVALMILGREPPEYFPRSYLATQERFQNALHDAARAEPGKTAKKVKL
jgi:glycine/D-amino acid oxidase-like deaminating enzyme